MQPRIQPQTQRRFGQSLLELVAATTVLAITVVPALRLMRDGLETSRRTETANHLATLCVSKLEEQLALSAATWTSSTVSGDFSSEGYSNLRYTAVRSDHTDNGGIADELMAVAVTAYEDQDGDDTLDTSEPRVVFASKIAQTLSYQDEVSGS